MPEIARDENAVADKISFVAVTQLLVVTAATDCSSVGWSELITYQKALQREAFRNLLA